MKTTKKENQVPVKWWTDGVPVEGSAVAQVEAIATLPFIHKHIAIMPDVHLGKGATVGSVIATTGAIIPAAVGVDLGCGMMAHRLNLTSHDLPDNLLAIRGAIEAAVPHGRTDNGGANDRGAWGTVPESASMSWRYISQEFDRICAKHPAIAKSNNERHLGTLGTGNHFIEICLDESDRVWVMLHSGSRGVGGRIGSYFIEKAKREMEKWFIHLPDADLSYLPEGSEYFQDYRAAVSWAQTFAGINRWLMMLATVEAISREFGRDIESDSEAVNCHHNYISEERHFGENVFVTRKGAVSAQLGELGIIPGSMGAKSFIVRGKGNRDSFCSGSHGAGRRMSRTEAKRTFTLEDHARFTAGVECRKDVDVVDETPGAYKDIDAVMAAQSDLVDIVHTLKQVVCVKG
jgi:tRNA-splicing ligase RtcB